MARMTTKLTTTLAGLALAGLPVLASAQSPTSQQPERPTQSRQQQQDRTADQNSPEHHLNQAKRVLNDINPSSMQGDARTQITELKRNFNQLENAWRNQSSRSGRSDSAHATGHTGAVTGTESGTAATGTAGTSGSTSSTTSEQTGTTSGTTSSQPPRSGAASPMAGNDDWMRHYRSIDSTLDTLLGSAGAAATGTTGTSGTDARAGVSAGGDIDASLRSKLTEFRQHLNRFHAAAMSQSGRMGEEDRASANPHSGITGSMTGTAGTSGTSGQATSGTSGQSASGTAGQSASSTAGQTTSSAQRTAASASGQVDSAAIARLTASIDELLRSSATSGAAGTSGTAGATSSTTTGTAGTTGTASAGATVCVDRAKLEQLRRDIQALSRDQNQE